VVFGEAFFGVADGAEAFGGDVLLAADKVEDFFGDGVEEEAVAGEIAALGVFGCGGEADGVGVSAVGVDAVGAEGGDFGLEFFMADEDDAEGGADFLAAGEDGDDFFGFGGGGDVVILGFSAHDLIADTAAGPVGGVSAGAELLDDVESEMFG